MVQWESGWLKTAEEFHWIFSQCPSSRPLGHHDHRSVYNVHRPTGDCPVCRMAGPALDGETTILYLNWKLKDCCTNLTHPKMFILARRALSKEAAKWPGSWGATRIHTLSGRIYWQERYCALFKLKLKVIICCFVWTPQIKLFHISLLTLLLGVVLQMSLFFNPPCKTLFAYALC